MLPYYYAAKVKHIALFALVFLLFNNAYSQQSALGDFVWYDLNNDGIQDPGEPQLNGVQVDIYTLNPFTGTYVLVGNQTTTADGTYCFTDANTVFTAGQTYYLTIPNPVLEPGTGNPTAPTLANAGPPSFTQDLVDSDAVIFTADPTAPFAGDPTIEFLATPGFASIKSLDFGFYTLCADLEVEIPPIFFACEGEEIEVVVDVQGATGAPGFEWSTGDNLAVNTLLITASTSQVYSVTVTDELGCTASAETYFEVERCPLDLSLTKTVDLMDVLVPGQTAAFTISVCNEGESVVDSIEVYDYLPDGYILNDAAWTIIGATTTGITANIELSISNGGLPSTGLLPGTCIDIPLAADIDACAGADNLTNVALINFASDLYGFQDDIDSTPGATIIDEDDTDSVAAPIFDLALRKTIETVQVSYCVTDTIVFNIEVINQASAIASDITIIDYLPEGLTFSPTDNGGWSFDPVGNLASFVIPGNLGAGESIIVPISLVVDCGTSIDAWTNIAEIFSAEDEFGADMSFLDIDSQYDDIPDNDIGGTPGSQEDDHVDDNGEDKDGDFITDEDDHDPALVPIFDLALIKEVATPGPYDYGQNVTFNITVCNQGNIVARDIDIVDYIPVGYTFHPTANSPMWSMMGMTASTMTIGQLPPEECTVVPLVMIVNQTSGGAKDWTNYAEIMGAFDNLGADMTDFDMDSTPSSNSAEENAVCLGDDDDDNINGKGPKKGEDEDDHDPAGIEIIDLALRKNLLTAGPYSYGDVLDYQIEVFNQGSDTVASVGIIDYFNEGLEITNTNFPTWENGINPNTAATKLKDLAPGESQIVNIEFILTKSMNLDAWDNCAEIYYMEDSDWVDLLDEDSTPDDINGNDIGGNVNTPEDDEINDNGLDLDGDGVFDEDDHDCDRITVYDLALTKTTTATGPFDYGQVIPFTITICNQGNGIVDQVVVEDYVPAGFLLVPDANWTAAGIHTTGEIIPGQCITVPLNMTLEQIDCATNKTWYNYAEIISYLDEDDILRTSDLDSDHGSNSGYENSVLLGDDFDDEILGCGEIEDEDEDDHDVSGLDIYDLALRKTSNVTGMVKYGDVITFTIDVINQGSLPVRDVNIIDYIPDGFTFLASNAGVWTTVSNSSIANAVIDQIDECETKTITIQLMVNKSESLLDNWINYAEIQSFKDLNFIDVSNLDVDSTPDSSQSNDIGGTPDSDEDDHIADSSDDYDGDGITDEDDHDPERISIYDVAMIKVLDTPSPYTYGQTLDYTVTICNQGNEDVDLVNVQDYIPAGMSIIADANWSAAGLHVTGLIEPDNCVDVPLQMTVNQLECSDEKSWINYAGIINYTDEEGVVQVMDADSNHGSNNPYENDVLPGDDFDDQLNGCGETVGEDEDDHDVAGIEVYDLALRKTTTTSGPYKYGMTVTFQIEVFNQGSEIIRNIEVVDYIPDGMTFSSTNAMPWTTISGSNMAAATIDELAPCESEILTLELILTKSVEAGDNWINEAEIKSYQDVDLNIVSDLDFDSTIDAIQGNDIGGNTETCEDNEINDSGTDLDGDGCTDEDDHDPERIAIYDVAMIKELITVEPAGGFTYNDILTFRITICNQGNEDLDQVVIQDYLPPGLAFTPNNGWSASATYTSGVIAPDACVTVDLDVTIIKTNGGEKDWINYAEVISYRDEAGVVQNMDADSMHDSNNAYENDVEPGDVFDNDLYGCGESEGEDEDDHDVAGIELVDLALSKTTTQTGPFKLGDEICYDIEVFNQGSRIVTETRIADYIPNGLTYLPSNFPTWDTDPSGLVASGKIKNLAPGESQVIEICLAVDKYFVEGSGDTAWDNVAEIYYMEDNEWNDLQDADSSPDLNPNNDCGTGVQTADDNEINECGCPAGEDEDDQDPERIEIFDLALIKTIDTPEPYSYCQAIDFTITVCNQGNEPATQINVADYLPAGFEYDGALNPAWSGAHPLITTVVSGPLMPSTCIDIPLTLTVNNTSGGYTDWINYAEITSAANRNGVDRTIWDLDSTPGTNATHETNVQPGDDDDDNLYGCGPLVGEDEDDHDPAGIEVFDLALDKRIITPGPYAFGDTVCYAITVYNQGNLDARNIGVIDYHPVGLENVIHNYPVWDYDLTDRESTHLIMGPLVPGDQVTFDICLEVQKLKNNEEAWDNRAEIYFAKDIDFITRQDIDSNPDAIVGNDIGGRPWTLEDNYIDDDGTDCDNTNIPLCRFDEIGIVDEDDEDVARIEIPDLALRKRLLTPAPHQYGDLFEFDICLFNQGNEDANNIEITDYLPDGYVFDALINPGWSELANGDLQYTHAGPLAAVDSICLPLFLEFVCTTGGEKDWINYAEITNFEGRECSFPDGGLPYTNRNDWEVDSTPGSNSIWEQNVEIPLYNDPIELAFPWDDEICGCGPMYDEDEDDHDPAGIEVFDLAINKAEITVGPYIYGDIIQFDLTVYNQGSTDAFDAEITDYLPCGLEFVEDGTNSDWVYTPFDDLATTIIPDSLIPGASYTQPLYLRVVPCCEDPAIAWTNTGEVSDATTEYLYDATDIDSTPDTINQEVNVIDDELKNPDDEDDHDIEQPDIFDLALRKTTTYADLELDDPNIFTITVFNQGNTVIQDIQVVDYPSSAYQFTTADNPGWTTGSTGYLYYTHEDVFLQPGDSIKVDIHLSLDASLVTQVEDQYNCAEIVSFTDEFGNDQSANDADSVPDDNPGNDNVVIPGDSNDDEIKENGPKLDPFGDEDDKDVADVQLLGKIGDWVWIDCNGNGIQDIGEIGLPGVRIDLVDAWNIVIRSVYTDQDGRYLFELVPPGDYFIRVTLPSGYEYTFPNVGNSEYHDSDIDNSNGPGTTQVENIQGRECDLESFDVGVYKCIPVGQHVWYDSNENNTQDANENGVNGVKVELYRLSAGNYILWDYQYTGPDPNTVSGDGYYKFCVAPGTYYMKYIVSNYGLVPVIPDAANDDVDSDVTGANGINTTNVIVINCEEDHCNINAGFQNEARLGDRVWADFDGNGYQDSNEPGLSSVQVSLYDMNGNMVDQVNTDPNGNFEFELLPSGDYYLQYTPPAGYVSSPSNMGLDDNMDSDIDHAYGYNTTNMITLNPNDVETSFDAGFYESSILSISTIKLGAEHIDDHNALIFNVQANDFVTSFSIMRSIDDAIFTEVITLDATQNETETYEHSDFDISASGVYYYKVVATLKNTELEESNVFAIDLLDIRTKDEASFSIHPNPSNGDVWIKGKGAMLDATFDVKIINSEGKTIYTNTIVNESNETNYKLDVTHLISGVYEVQITSQNGSGNYRILIMD